VLADRHGTVLVAADWGPLLGVIAVHWAPLLQNARPVARITTLVVDEEARGRGVGRLLLKAGAQAARQAGCDDLELTSGLRRVEAHAFYRAQGFQETSLRFLRNLRRNRAAQEE
jgi:aminoglycoside 6'-N-acetyltransferase I